MQGFTENTNLKLELDRLFLELDRLKNRTDEEVEQDRLNMKISVKKVTQGKS